jgi:hypothetical protein
MKEAQDASRAGETIDVLRTQLQELEDQFKAEADALTAKMDPLREQLETLSIKPSKSNISVTLLALGWAPYWRAESGELVPAWQ